jgi:hypothetical protein
VLHSYGHGGNVAFIIFESEGTGVCFNLIICRKLPKAKGTEAFLFEAAYGM